MRKSIDIELDKKKIRGLKEITNSLKNKLSGLFGFRKKINIMVDDLTDLQNEDKSNRLNFNFEIDKTENNENTLLSRDLSKLGYKYLRNSDDRSKYISCKNIKNMEKINKLVDRSVFELYEKTGIKPGDIIADKYTFYKNIIEVVGQHEEKRGNNIIYGKGKDNLKTFEDIIENNCGVCNDLCLFTQILLCRYGINTKICVGSHKTGEQHAFLKDNNIAIDLNNLASKGVHEFSNYKDKWLKSFTGTYDFFNPIK